MRTQNVIIRLKEILSQNIKPNIKQKGLDRTGLKVSAPVYKFDIFGKGGKSLSCVFEGKRSQGGSGKAGKNPRLFDIFVIGIRHFCFYWGKYV